MRLYLHIPFCMRKCSYCDFHSIVADKSTMISYLSTLGREIRLLKVALTPMDEEVLSIYFGGGTPSIYSPAELGRILTLCREELKVGDGAEITVEVNPGSWKEKELIEAARMGFNRLSIGAQSFDPKILRILGRSHTHLDTLRLAKAAKKSGCFDINLDLIYGVPMQSLESWRCTLETAVRLSPHHLSIYALTLPQGSPMRRMVEDGIWNTPEEDQIAEMYDVACDILKKAGYGHYEISNFALPGKECQHNMAYWSRSAYVGVGSGAHSFLPTSLRWSNLKDVSGYMRAVGQGILPLEEVELLTREEAWEEEVMLSLRTSWGLDLDVLGEVRNTVHLADMIKGWVSSGLAWQEHGMMGLSERGMLVSNDLIARLIGG